MYSFLNEDDFVRFDKDEKFFDNRKQAEEYVKENIIPFDKNKVKEYLAKLFKVYDIRDMDDILPDSFIKEYSPPLPSHRRLGVEATRSS